jgi:hypothetical protein
METPKGSVIVELYDLALTPRKDDRFGRIVTKKSLTEDDLIAIAVSRRTDLNANTLKACMNILKEIAMEEVVNGSSVRFGLSFYQLGVEGVFIGDNAAWDSSQHNLIINSVPVADLRQALKTTAVSVRGMASSGTFINSVTDVTTKQVNSRLTPGGGANVTGNRIKIAGDASGIGLSLINQATNEVISIPMTSLLANEPSKLSFVVPANLPAGDYKLSVGTQFSNSLTLLKEVRTFVFDYVLSVLN